MDGTAAYRARLDRVLRYLDENPDGAQDLETLSGIAAFSKFHFQRQFSAFFGLSAGAYGQRLRLLRAAHWLAYYPRRRVLDIALDSGYGGPEAFARAFRQVFGQSPSAFRVAPDWPSWHAATQAIQEVRMTHARRDYALTDVELVDFPETPLMVLMHRGDPTLLGETIRRFIDWRRAHKLPPQRFATFNLAYDDPATTPAEAYRFGLGVATHQNYPSDDSGLAPLTIPAGRCAKIRHIGPDSGIAGAVLFLYRVWLPQSGLIPRDFPLFFQRVTLFPDVPEADMVTDIFLPI